MPHNHMTRDIKAKGSCPACDEYRETKDRSEKG